VVEATPSTVSTGMTCEPERCDSPLATYQCYPTRRRMEHCVSSEGSRTLLKIELAQIYLRAMLSSAA